MAYKIGWFSSGEVKSPEGRRAARELFTTVMDAKNYLGIEISFVFSNIEPGERPYGDELFHFVNKYNLPLVTLSSENFAPKMREKGKQESRGPGGKIDYSKPSETLIKWRKLYDEICLSPGYLGDFERPDLCVLAGDMTIWSPVKCKYFDAINLHPALPDGPKGTWQDVIWEMIEHVKKEHGVMMHLVIPELDRGPPVTYCRFPLKGPEYERFWNDKMADTRTMAHIKERSGENYPLFQKIRQDGAQRECPLVVQTIKSFSDGVIKIVDKEVRYSDDRLLEQGYDLTEQINRKIGALSE
jgi:folate-dependent phosphoribosylglycinamide formyltransferase PurN